MPPKPDPPPKTVDVLCAKCKTYVRAPRTRENLPIPSSMRWERIGRGNFAVCHDCKRET